MRPEKKRFLTPIILPILILLLCIISAGLLAYAKTAVAGDTFPVAESSGDILTVGVPVDRCPIFYRDADTNEITGIGVDLMHIAAEKAGYTAVFKPIEEKTLRDALDNDAYDVLVPFGSAITSTSGKPSIISDNLFQTQFTLVTDDRRKLPPLTDLRIGMLSSLGGVEETVRQLYHGINIITYDTMDDSIKALRSDEVDALMHNSYVWSYVLQKPAYQDLMVQPSAMVTMDFRAGTVDTSKGRVVIDRLNDGIASLTDTQRQAITLDYTSRRLYQDTLSDQLYEHKFHLIIFFLLILFIVLIALQRIHAVRKEQEEKMRLILEHDPLTGLLNMNGFRKRVEELLRAHPDTPYFLSYNNIRDFKFINDSLGRKAGDELLKFWASTSIKTLSDEEAIGRIAADRFAVLRHIAGEERMLEDEQNVFIPMQNFFINQGKDNKVQTTSGIYVLSPKDFRDIDVDHMLDLARVAEKKVRESRQGDYAFYNPEQWERGKQIADVINFLPAALQSGDIEVWYQPQVNYDTGQIIGAEALCRWKHTKLGWLRPADFISTLEESGHIYDLDSYVWDRACQDLHRWKEQGIHRTISVNVSRSDIRADRNIPGQFYDLIQKYGLTTDQLHIEITETAYAEDPALIIQTTVKLREFGFQVEMDDFGSGYSSLHMLKEVPVDRIKLDLHFLTEEGDPERCRIIVDHTVTMIQALGMSLIAEGVENVSQAQFLHSIGCSEMQGFYFYKPMPVEEFERLGDSIALV